MGKRGKARTRFEPAAATAVDQADQRAAGWTAPGWAQAGLGAFFLVACAFGVLEVHYSNDTWIGLAAGRQIMTQGRVPTTDQFSYTFYGQTWYNQNWLSHVFFWLLYDKLSPNAVVLGTWAVGVGIFSMVLAATWVRCRSWMAATAAAGIVAFACRDWLSIRPATIQFLLLAALWLSLSALASQGRPGHQAGPKGKRGAGFEKPADRPGHRRWWPLILLLAVLSVWTHAHGSFVLGFGLAAMFLGCNLLAWVFRRPATISRGQFLALTVIGLATAVAGAALSPFGIENYTHPLKVVESALFRQVGEWVPPFREADRFPPVNRFWVALSIAIGVPLVTLMLRGFARGSEADDHADARARLPRYSLPTVLLDLASVGAGLYWAMFARRFAPTFYILAAPALTTFTIWLAGSLPARLQRNLATALVCGAWVAAGVLGFVTYRFAYRDLVADVQPDGDYTLLDRVTHNDHRLRMVIEFLNRNGLAANVMSEWKVSGAIMFYAPGARVFIDGRAQQVYDEKHYKTYMWLLSSADTNPDLARQLLDIFKTDAVLLPRWASVMKLIEVLQSDPAWLQVLDTPAAMIWVRDGSKLLAELARRERQGDLWWPDYPETELVRGSLWVSTSPSDPQRAVELWQSAVARDPTLGIPGYVWITRALRRVGCVEQAAAYLQSERARLIESASRLPPRIQAALLEELDRCEQMLIQRPGSGGPGAN